jgi:hypothetical protein
MELVEDDERGGIPQSTRSEVNIAAVAADLFKNDCQITLGMIAESLNIPKTVVLRILKEDFCSRVFSCFTIIRQPTQLPILTPKNVTNLYNPPYFPDFSPPGYFAFKLKLKLK